MDARIRIGLLAMAGLSLSACAIGTEMGWTSDHAAPSDVVRSNCDSAVKTLEGKADHATAMHACVEAKTRQHVD
jgi:hypothetical protein